MIFDYEKWKKSENMRIMFCVKVLTLAGTEKVEIFNISWKSMIFLKISENDDFDLKNTAKTLWNLAFSGFERKVLNFS